MCQQKPTGDGSRAINGAGLTRIRAGLYPCLAVVDVLNKEKKYKKYHTGTGIPDPTLDPRGSGLGSEFYTLEGIGPGLGPSLTIRVRVWVWRYPEGLDSFTALDGRGRATISGRMLFSNT
ncbi:hypothetical protein M9H77_18652 [Catharanthus roseus]|uniref:Uncharacterized protein n=1 Tax=Catharanthus roseus TaxID=4058 RepID=A0ACC0B827_CATRO|nr:hypothetical protein M9H77_18652 [Catharanthus roseus]